jgi:hypothetical protein
MIAVRPFLPLSTASIPIRHASSSSLSSSLLSHSTVTSSPSSSLAYAPLVGVCRSSLIVGRPLVAQHQRHPIHITRRSLAV